MDKYTVTLAIRGTANGFAPSVGTANRWQADQIANRWQSVHPENVAAILPTVPHGQRLARYL